MISRCELLKCGLLNSEFCASCKSLSKEVKTYKNWKGNLSEYLKIGDLVDEDIECYFIEVLPPATMNGNLIQIGEPYDHVEGKATYSTLVKTFEGWAYAGNCHKGKCENKESIYNWR